MHKEKEGMLKISDFSQKSREEESNFAQTNVCAIMEKPINNAPRYLSVFFVSFQNRSEKKLLLTIKRKEKKMKKIFGISLIGILAAMPMMAGADPVAGDPGTTTSDAVAASSAPKYALAEANASLDGKVATAGYVKGAYNAAIKGINKVQEEIDTANTNLTNANTALTNAQNSLTTDYATKTGVAATVNSATTSGSFTGASVSGSFSDATVSGTVTGTATGTIPAIVTWGTDAEGTAPATASLSNTTISGSATGTMTGTASGSTTGTVTVSGYQASAQS